MIALITVISNVLFVSYIVIRSHFDIQNQWTLWIHHTAETLLLTINVLTNFLSVAISYRCCDSLIVLCCGCLRCCRMIPITTDDHDAILLEQIMRHSNDRTTGTSEE